MDSDPELEIIEKDSGMSSLGGSKDETPEKHSEAVAVEEAVVADAVAAPEAAPEPTVTVAVTSSNTVAKAKPADNYDDEPDESLVERLWGLTEMFPDPLRNATSKLSQLTVNTVKGAYSFSCSATWFVLTTSVILFAPVVFETERAQMMEMQKTHQKQVLLGPGSAMAATGGVAPPLPTMR